jgi:hypothetical protein
VVIPASYALPRGCQASVFSLDVVSSELKDPVRLKHAELVEDVALDVMAKLVTAVRAVIVQVIPRAVFQITVKRARRDQSLGDDDSAVDKKRLEFLTFVERSAPGSCGRFEIQENSKEGIFNG